MWREVNPALGYYLQRGPMKILPGLLSSIPHMPDAQVGVGYTNLSEKLRIRQLLCPRQCETQLLRLNLDESTDKIT